MSVVPSIGSTAMSVSGGAPSPMRSPLNSIGASSFSPSPMTTMPSIETVAKHGAHGVDGSAVGTVLVAPAHPPGGGHGGGFGDTDEFEGEVAIGSTHRVARYSGNPDDQMLVGPTTPSDNGCPIPCNRGISRMVASGRVISEPKSRRTAAWSVSSWRGGLSRPSRPFLPEVATRHS